MRRPATATTPAAMAPGTWCDAPLRAIEVDDAAAEAVLLDLTKGVEELGVWVKNALETGVLLKTGVEVGAVGVELVGVYPAGTRVKVLVTVAASAASAIGARKRRRVLVTCMLIVVD